MTKPLSVLLVDDDPDDRALVARSLGKEFPGVRVSQAPDRRTFDEALAGGGFDAVITDYRLRWADGLQVLREVRARWPECPVVMFTGTGNEEVAAEALKAGLDDYVVKGTQHLVRLAGSLRTALERRAERRRTARLEERLRRARQSEGLATVAAGVAHGFNNLLQVVLGNAELARWEAPEGSPLAAHLEGVRGAVLQATALTAQLLAFTGQAGAGTGAADLSAEVDQAVRGLEPPLSAGARVELHLAADLPRVPRGRERLREVAETLVRNAAEALGPGGGAITVATRPAPEGPADPPGAWFGADLDGRSCAVLEVADTGCGMTPETVERIFDPFFSTKFLGRGLGLPAALGMVRALEGAIEVESVPGRGSCFRVFLPLTPGTSAAPAPPAPGLAGGPVAAFGRDRTVLLADDEDTVRATTAALLDRLGFSVLTARGGAEAVELFRARAKDLSAVVLDLAMPGVDGGEALARMRQIAPQVPVLVASGYDQAEAARRRADGADGFLPKPYRLADLARALAAVLG